MESKYKKNHTCRILFFIALSLDLIGMILSTLLLLLKKDTFIVIVSLILFFWLSLIFWITYFIEKRSILIIQEDQVIFYYHVFSKPKIKYNHKNGYSIFYKDISNISHDLHKGDGFVSANTTFYHIQFNDGKTISFTLFQFGKKQEKLIFENLLKTFYQYKNNQKK